MFETILGLVMIYATVHYIVLSFSKRFADRSTYEKVVSIAGVVSVALVYIGTMINQ